MPSAEEPEVQACLILRGGWCRSARTASVGHSLTACKLDRSSDALESVHVPFTSIYYRTSVCNSRSESAHCPLSLSIHATFLSFVSTSGVQLCRKLRQHGGDHEDVAAIIRAAAPDAIAVGGGATLFAERHPSRSSRASTRLRVGGRRSREGRLRHERVRPADAGRDPPSQRRCFSGAKVSTACGLAAGAVVAAAAATPRIPPAGRRQFFQQRQQQRQQQR